MSFYNIDFEVKYNDIYNELLYKIDNIDLSSEEKYNREDITTICTNLYQHELSQVFYASSLLDDKIDKGIQQVYDNYLSKSESFTKILNNAKQHLFSYDNNNISLTSEQKTNLQQNSSYFLLLMLFSENIFYITHKCICQMIKTNNIYLPLLINLETLLEETLQNKF